MSDFFNKVQLLAQDFPQKTAIISAQGETTYADLMGYCAAILGHIPADKKTVAIYGPSSALWVAALLALEFSGKRIVPLPEFFSREQCQHVLQDCAVDFILRDPVCPGFDGVDDYVWSSAQASMKQGHAKPSQQILYTSGTSGNPKGVLHDSAVLDAKANALIVAAKAGARDRHLSVLPFSLLLEQIVGVRLALSIGACCIIEPMVFQRCMTGDFSLLHQVTEQFKPTTSVLVPELLRGWVLSLAHVRKNAVETLRYVAVGGGHVPDGLAQKAWDLNIPVYEGYGLTECASVVCVNHFGNRKAGTVGKPLEGVVINICEGEIQVQGPSVMQGYLHGDPVQECWMTGDEGTIDEDGYLKVYGRKDNVLVTSLGRNINPEWVENKVLEDPRIERCFVFGEEKAFPSAVLVVHPPFKAHFNASDNNETLIQQLFQGIPAYAVPDRLIVSDRETLHQQGLLTSNARPKRKAITQFYSL